MICGSAIRFKGFGLESRARARTDQFGSSLAHFHAVRESRSFQAWSRIAAGVVVAIVRCRRWSNFDEAEDGPSVDSTLPQHFRLLLVQVLPECLVDQLKSCALKIAA